MSGKRCGHGDDAVTLCHRLAYVYVRTPSHHTWLQPWCGRCESWLPLGPSNDVGCEVEIRAAEIAVGPEPKYRPSITAKHLREGVGWQACKYGHGADWCSVNADCLAGYLARCIHDHDSHHIVEHQRAGGGK